MERISSTVEPQMILTNENKTLITNVFTYLVELISSNFENSKAIFSYFLEFSTDLILKRNDVKSTFFISKYIIVIKVLYKNCFTFRCGVNSKKWKINRIREMGNCFEMAWIHL